MQHDLQWFLYEYNHRLHIHVLIQSTGCSHFLSEQGTTFSDLPYNLCHLQYLNTVTILFMKGKLILKPINKKLD